MKEELKRNTFVIGVAALLLATLACAEVSQEQAVGIAETALADAEAQMVETTIAEGTAGAENLDLGVDDDLNACELLPETHAETMLGGAAQGVQNTPGNCTYIDQNARAVSVSVIEDEIAGGSGWARIQAAAEENDPAIYEPVDVPWGDAYWEKDCSCVVTFYDGYVIFTHAGNYWEYPDVDVKALSTRMIYNAVYIMGYECPPDSCPD